jgi:hypothetical protein
LGQLLSTNTPHLRKGADDGCDPGSRIVWPVGMRPPTWTGMLWRIPPVRSRRFPPIGFIHPCRPALVAHPPAGPGWLHEMKHDGYRLLARKEDDRVTLWSRYGTDFTDRLRGIADAVRSLPVDNALSTARRSYFARMDIPTSPLCAPRPVASKPHSSPSTFSASKAMISASGLWRSGERRSRSWSRMLTTSSSA